MERVKGTEWTLQWPLLCLCLKPEPGPLDSRHNSLTLALGIGWLQIPGQGPNPAGTWAGSTCGERAACSGRGDARNHARQPAGQGPRPLGGGTGGRVQVPVCLFL